MCNIIFPNNNNNNKIKIATLIKGTNNINNNEESFFTELGLNINEAIFMHQVHMDNIIKIDKNNIGLFGGRERLVKDADALITNLKNIPLVIQTADCAPVILYCDKTSSIAAIHSGWRGTVKNIVSKAIDLMKKEYDAEPSNIYAYVGVYIAQKDYEVGDEVAIHFKNKVIINDKWHIDNGLEIKEQMLSCGILESNIEISPFNSYDREFYSYRRDGAKGGRMLTLAVII